MNTSLKYRNEKCKQVKIENRIISILRNIYKQKVRLEKKKIRTDQLTEQTKIDNKRISEMGNSNKLYCKALSIL